MKKTPEEMIENFIENWNVGHEDKEQKIEFAEMMREQLKEIAQCQQDNAETAINFADWINKNNYEKVHGDRWVQTFSSFTHSTRELYDIYLIKTTLNKQ